jgi:hypothetical protein
MQLLISLKNSFLFFTNCSQQFYCIPISIIWHLQSHGFCIDECFDNLLFFACHGVLLAFTDFFFVEKFQKMKWLWGKVFWSKKVFYCCWSFFGKWHSDFQIFKNSQFVIWQRRRSLFQNRVQTVLVTSRSVLVRISVGQTTQLFGSVVINRTRLS